MQWMVRYARGFFWSLGFLEIYLGLWNVGLYLTGHSHVRRHAATVAALYGVAIVLGALSCFTAYAWRRNHRYARPLILINSLFCQICFPLGLAAGGVGVYWCCSRKMRESEPARANFDHQPRPGDGTSKWLQKVAPLVNLAVWWGAYFGAKAWGQAQGLDSNRAFVGVIGFLLIINLCGLITTFFHELGHAAAGWAVHMQLASFKVGPFKAQKLRGKWKFDFKLSSLPAGIGGAVGTKPLHLNDLPKRMAFVAAGGPAASLVTALAAFVVLLYAPGSPWEAWWQVPALIAADAAAAAVLNLIPLGLGEMYSDGAHVVQMLRGGPEADRRVALMMMLSTTITPTRPRDLDPIALERGTRAVTGDKLEGILHLLQVICAADRGDMTAARDHLEHFLQRMPTPQSAGRAASAAEMAFYIAYVDGNASRASQWLCGAEQLAMQQKTPLTDVIDYWMAVTAVREAEGQRAEADDAYSKAMRIAATRPPAGRYQQEVDLLERVHRGDWLRSNIVMAEAVA